MLEGSGESKLSFFPFRVVDAVGPRKKDLVRRTPFLFCVLSLSSCTALRQAAERGSSSPHTPAETHNVGPHEDSIWTRCSGPVDLIYKLPSSTGGHPEQPQLL